MYSYKYTGEYMDITDKVLKNILPNIDKKSKQHIFSFGKKSEEEIPYIPHQCQVCDKTIGQSRLYTYHKGNYYHQECFMHKKRGR